MQVFSSVPWREGEGGEGKSWFLADHGPAFVVRIAAGLVVALSSAVLIAWIAGGARLSNYYGGLPRAVPVPLTPVLFLCACVALFAAGRLEGRGSQAGARERRDRWLVRGGGLAIVLFGMLRIAKDVFAWRLPLDTFPLLWLADEPLAGLRMAPATAVNFVLLGAALLLGRGKVWAERLYQNFTFAALLIAALSIAHFVYGGQPIFELAQMSIVTSTLFVLTCLAMLALRPDRGLVRLWRTSTEGGRVVRYLLLPAIALPPLMGWLRMQSEALGVFGPGAALSFFVLVNSSVLATLIASAASLLDRADSRRREAEGRTLKKLEQLQLLHQITRATAERQDPASIFQVAVRSIEDRLPADFSCVCRYDGPGTLLEVVSIGVKSQAMAGKLRLAESATFAIDPNGLERCISGALVYEEDLSRIAMPFAQRLADCGLGSLVLAPLQADDRVFGLMVVARRQPRGFTSTECEFLRQLGDNVALSASQAELHATLQTAYVDLRQSQQTVVRQESLRSLGEMASGIAHDINNSISPAAIHAELLLEGEKALSPEGRSRLATVQRAISDVAQTVSRMQDLYRRRVGEESSTPVKLNVLVEQVLELTRPRWRDTPQERGVVIEVVTSLRADLPLVSGIESEVREALTNLIFNAVDAMPAGGTLELRTGTRRPEGLASPGAKAPSQVLLEVADTGTGMDEETRRRCLEPFFTTKGDRGSGLGLAMVFSVAERHDAEVEIESEPGKGTTVRLVFPAADFASATPAEPEALLPIRSLRILVVDDDPIVLATLCDALSGDGHRVVPASGGAAGIEEFRRSVAQGPRFDLVFTDLGMPQIDGRRVAAAIKEASATTPIILLTGWGQRMFNEQDLPAHVDLILSKPPRIKDLRQAVRRLHRGA